MLTYAKATDMLKRIKDQRVGKNLGQNVFLIKVKNEFHIVSERVPFIVINKDNEYTLFNLRSNRISSKLINILTPTRAKLKGKKIFFDNMPYYHGIKFNAKGELILPEAYSRNSVEHLQCIECTTHYSTELCPTHHRNKLTEIENNAD